MLAAELLDRARTGMRSVEDSAFAISSHRAARASMYEAHDRLAELVDPSRVHPLLTTYASNAERWKECIRIQQLQADMARVIPQLDRRVARRTKIWWFSMMEVVAVLRRNDYAAPSLPVTVPAWSRWRIAWLVTFRKSTFHR